MQKEGLPESIGLAWPIAGLGLALDQRRGHILASRVFRFAGIPMFNADFRSRLLRRSLPAALVAAFALVSAARAEITIQDEGSGGVLLSNLQTGNAPPVLAQSPQSRRLAPTPSGSGRSLARDGKLARLVLAAADAHGIPEALLHAVIETESNFNAHAVSVKGALGLMQLMPQTARELGVADALDPAANIDGGARYLKELLARFGNDVPLALAAYNAGPAAVQRSGGIPRFAETMRYVPRVMARYHSLQSAAR